MYCVDNLCKLSTGGNIINTPCLGKESKVSRRRNGGRWAHILKIFFLQQLLHDFKWTLRILDIVMAYSVFYSQLNFFYNLSSPISTPISHFVFQLSKFFSLYHFWIKSKANNFFHLPGIIIACISCLLVYIDAWRGLLCSQPKKNQ